MIIETIVEGKNNLVEKIFYKKKIFIYKKYLKDQGNGINYSRYKSETSFINLLTSKKIKNLPLILATDPYSQENLFNFINGKKVKKITKKDIAQCINFIKKINFQISNKKISNFKMATEACISIDDHIKTAEKIAKENNSSSLKEKELILSPSDFGFHNVIKKKSKLYFFDFEYAGKDDPVKLMSDYICQPDYKLNMNQINYFYKNILKIFNNKKKINKRFQAVIYIHRIKWCCVILSEILNKKYFKRRKFAKSNINLRKCFNKAKKYYNDHLKIIKEIYIDKNVLN